HVVRLGNVRIGYAAVHRAHRGAGLVVVEADAFGALLGDDVEDLARQRRPHRPVGCLPVHGALIDGRIGALRLACAAVDAFAGDHGRHERELRRSVPAACLAKLAETVKQNRLDQGAPGASSLTTGGASWNAPPCGWMIWARLRRPRWRRLSMARRSSARPSMRDVESPVTSRASSLL